MHPDPRMTDNYLPAEVFVRGSLKIGISQLPGHVGYDLRTK
jgi:hypothetical protein